MVTRQIWASKRASVDAKLQEMINSLELPAVYAAVHIRLGDKVYGPGRREAKIQPFERYVDALIEGWQPGGWDTVVVCSDDSSAAAEVERMAGRRGKRWKILSASSCAAGQALMKDAQHGGHEQQVFNAQPASTRIAAITLLFAEIQLMAKASFLVCTYSSNVTRFVALLRDNPTVSLDDEWTNA